MDRITSHPEQTKPVTRIVLAALLLATMAVTVTARDAGAHSGSWVVIKANGTYLRSCPSTSCGKVVLAPNGSTVTPDRHRGNWAYVTYDGARGWVSLNVITPAAAPAPPAASGAATCYWNFWGSTVCAPQWMADEIVAAANAYGVSSWTLLSVAACESNFNPDTYGAAGEVGIFQWTEYTWGWIGAGDRWSTRDQIWATARAFSWGYASHWTCARLLGVA